MDRNGWIDVWSLGWNNDLELDGCWVCGVEIREVEGRGSVWQKVDVCMWVRERE